MKITADRFPTHKIRKSISFTSIQPTFCNHSDRDALWQGRDYWMCGHCWVKFWGKKGDISHPVM